MLWARLDEELVEHPRLTILEGGAAGADRQAREWAKSRGVRVETFEADWTTLGRSAGPRRNEQMAAAHASAVLAFSLTWPLTTGTEGMCLIGYRSGLSVSVVTPDGVERPYGLSG